MRRSLCLSVGLALAMPMAARASMAGESPATISSDSYQTLGKLVLMHKGRAKPLETVAREEIKGIYGRQSIKLLDARGKPVATWGPMAAFFDMTVRPEFWDDQAIVLVEYGPLKEMILAETARAELAAVASRTTDPIAKSEVQALAKSAPVPVSQRNVNALVGLPGLSENDRKVLQALAFRLGPEHKWVAPRELEETRVAVDGRAIPFETWFEDIAMRRQRGDEMIATAPALSTIEQRAYEVGEHLAHYRMIRGDRDVLLMRPEDWADFAVPRPANAAYMAFTSEALRAYREHHSLESLSPMQMDALETLKAHLENVQDRKDPGTDAEFDARFAAFIQESANWVPLRIVLKAQPEELERAGFPPRELAAFRAAYEDLRHAEDATPGRVPQAKAAAVVAAARNLGEKVGKLVHPEEADFVHRQAVAVGLAGDNLYPTPRKIDLEMLFNRTAPFYWAPAAYGMGLAFLALCLGITADRQSAMGSLRRGLYAIGMAGFVGGIALEVYGFALRVLISGWAPVTNMYETVIWVSLITAVIALVMELLSRKVYPALAASGVAMLGTTLAATVPSLLDPNIKGLQPVLRSNYWLTIHVLTEVSSYAAFALAMGLGLIATLYYLTATYRHSVRYGRLAVPLIPGLPLLILGGIGVVASYQSWAPPLLASTAGFYLCSFLAYLGVVPTIMATCAILGEAISRAAFRSRLEQEELVAAGFATATTAGTRHATAAGDHGGGVATLSRPTVDEIRDQAAEAWSKLDARGLAMQATAAKIKPLSNFIYRAMQVGVLLIAGGTILGGYWADKSWGRFWGWDPKEVWALITLLVYLIPLHGRFAGWINTFGLVCASVACFGSVMMAWYGVNFVLGVGLHSYGFVEGGGQGIVIATCIAVLSVVAAAAWRRSLASRPSADVA